MIHIVLRTEQSPFLAGEGDEDNTAGQGVAAGRQPAGHSITMDVPEALSSAPLWMSLERKASDPEMSPPRPR